MSTNGRVHHNTPGYAAGPVTKAPDWHGLVAWDMLFNNLTTGQSAVIHVANLTGTQYTATTSLASGQYRVWVRGVSSAGIFGVWSNPTDFTIQ